MDFKVENGILVFTGILDEKTTEAEFRNATEAGLAANQQTELVVDFSAVSRANSTALARWLQATLELQPKMSYVNAPPWLLTEMATNGEFGRNGSHVKSVQLPFASSESNKCIKRTLVVGVDIPILDCYDSISLDFKEGSDSYECEVELSIVLQCLSRQKPRIRGVHA